LGVLRIAYASDDVYAYAMTGRSDGIAAASFVPRRATRERAREYTPEYEKCGPARHSGAAAVAGGFFTLISKRVRVDAGPREELNLPPVRR